MSLRVIRGFLALSSRLARNSVWGQFCGRDRKGGAMRVGKFGLALAAFGSALLAGLGQTRAGPVLVDDPGAAVNEIIGPLQEARAQDAADAVKKYMVSTPNGKYDFDTVRNGFTAVSQGGKADVVDEIEHT